MTQLRKQRLPLAVGSLLMLMTVAGAFLWRVHPLAAAPSGATMTTSNSGGITIKFNSPTPFVTLLPQRPFATSATTDSRVITVSNTGSSAVTLFATDHTCALTDNLTQGSVPNGGVPPGGQFAAV